MISGRRSNGRTMNYLPHSMLNKLTLEPTLVLLFSHMLIQAHWLPLP